MTIEKNFGVKLSLSKANGRKLQKFYSVKINNYAVFLTLIFYEYIANMAIKFGKVSKKV